MSFLPGSPFLGLHRRRFAGPTGTVAPTVFYAASKSVASPISSSTGLAFLTDIVGAVAGDQFFVFLETANQAVTLSGDWTALSASPQGTGTAGAADATRLSVWRHIFDGANAPDWTYSDTLDHCVGSWIIVRGASTTINAIAGATEATADTSVSWPSVTTTEDLCLVVLFGSRSLPDSNTNAQSDGYTNANLTGLVEVADYNGAAGNGGGVMVAAGVMATAGAVGATTATLTTAASKGLITLALAPEA